MNMHSQLTNRSVVVIRGGLHQKERGQSLRSGASVYHGLRGHRDTYDIHFQSDGSFNHKGKQINKQRLFQTSATIFNALHGKSAGRLAKASKQYKTKHTGNSHIHRAEMGSHHTRRKILQKYGINTIPHWKLDTSEASSNNPLQQSIKQDLSYPVVVSPLPSSFSQDNVVVESESELVDILRAVSQHQDYVLLQEGVQGQAFSGLVLPKFREQKPYTFPLFELKHDRKFVNSSSRAEQNYQSPKKTDKNLQQMLKEIFQAAGLHCLARVDIAKSRRGNWYLLDIETHPRLDRHSLLAESTDRVGALMKDVYEQQVQAARSR